MSDKKIVIVTEANERVATGHLMECIVCRQYLEQMGMEADLLVNDDMPVSLKKRIVGEYFTYKKDIQKESSFLINFISDKKYSKILFNLRNIKNDILLEIKKTCFVQIICIDEFGNRKLDADIIINPMIDDYYWQYNTKAKLYCGSEYLVLPMELQEFRRKKKEINERIKKVTVSMGGADVGGTTLKLAKWLPLVDSELEINLVLGGAYHKEKNFKELISENDKIRVFHNISYLDRLFFESDLAFCAGGNTLHELAVMGIPAIVIPSMPHEVQNGKAFEKRGFSLCGSIASEFSCNELVKLYDRIKTKLVREEMHRAGKKAVDGKGYERIYKILRD